MRTYLYSSFAFVAIATNLRDRKLTEEESEESDTAPEGFEEPENVEEWDEYCKYLNGGASYCKYWLDPPHCLGDDSFCGYGDVPDPTSSPTTEAATTAAPTTTDAPTTTTAATTTEAPTTAAATTAAPTGDVKAQCDGYCKSLNGENSYCKWWLPNAVCKHGDQPCGTAELCPWDGSVATTEAPEGGDDDGESPQGDGEHHPECDTMCKGLNGENSYCKWWLQVPVCKHGDQACGGGADYCNAQDIPETTAGPTSEPDGSRHSGPSEECDDFCKYENGENSYCKWWKQDAVCKGGDQPCGPNQCAASGTTAAPTTAGPTQEGDTTAAPETTAAPDTHAGPSDPCDYYCADQNSEAPNGSYCKWWLDEAICKHGNQSCAPSVCENYPNDA